jgi:hypothetical protein
MTISQPRSACLCVHRAWIHQNTVGSKRSCGNSQLHEGMSAKTEIHINVADVHDLSSTFAAKRSVITFIRLNADKSVD